MCYSFNENPIEFRPIKPLSINISGLLIDNDLKRKVMCAIANKETFALYDTDNGSFTIFIDNKVTIASDYCAPVMIEHESEQQFYETVKVSLIGNRQFVSRSILIAEQATREMICSVTHALACPSHHAAAESQPYSGS